MEERLLWIVALLLAVSFRLEVAHADQRLSQAAHSVWRIQDGQFDSPNAIAQTSDGYIWIGTDRGLTRFDGVRFVTSNAITGLSASEFRVSAVLGTRDGSLWVGVPAAVVQIKAGKAVQYKIPAVPSMMVEEGDSSIWLSETRGPGGAPLCHLAEGNVQCYGPPAIHLKHASALARQDDGSLWLGGGGGLCHWQPTTATANCYLEQFLAPSAGLNGIASILPRTTASPLVGMSRIGDGLGLGTLANDRLDSFDIGGMSGSQVATTSIIQDRSGALWIGTMGQGVIRLQGGRSDHFGMKEGLSSDQVNGLFEDHEGVVWVLTSAGIDAFRSRLVSVFSTGEGLPYDGVGSVLPLSNGDVWLGNTTGLTAVRGDRVVSPEHKELFGDRAATSMFQDAAGRIWIGLNRTLQLYEKGALTELTDTGGVPVGVVQAIVQDGAGDIWVGVFQAPHRILRITGTRVAEELETEKVGDPFCFGADPQRGLWLGYKDGHIAHYHAGQWDITPADEASKGQVRSLLIEDGGAVLAATSEGLLVQEGARRQLLDVEHGLPCAATLAIVKDSLGAIWLNATCGLIRIGKAEFDRWRSDPSTVVQSRLFDITDGAQSGLAPFSPTAKLAPDGRLWIATGKVAEVIDPSMAAMAPPPVHVQVEELVADRKDHPVSLPIKLPAATRDVRIRYTALTTVAPQKTVFQTRLEGRDDRWTDVGAGREAFYTDLPPGTYTFYVRGSRNDARWSDDAKVAFEVAPLFYQTRWFIALCACVLFLLAYGAFLMRLRQVSNRLKQQMRGKIAERERIARDLHDTLLQDTQALVLSFQTVAEELPADGPVRQRMDTILDRADRILAQGRDKVLDLREHEVRTIDLLTALSRLGNELSSAHRCSFTTVVEGVVRPLAQGVHEEVYHIGREAILNAFQHAKASTIELHLIYGNDVFAAQIRDDGQGIDPATLKAGGKDGHFGLVGMRERAREIGGRLDIWSGAKPGTEIDLRVPALIAYGHMSSRRWLPWLAR